MLMRSCVYKDEDFYVVLVAHGSDSPLVRRDFVLTGLMHYCLESVDGKLEIFDGLSDEFYAVDDLWEGVDEVAAILLKDAARWGHGARLDDRYYDTISLYSEATENDLLREALS